MGKKGGYGKSPGANLFGFDHSPGPIEGRSGLRGVPRGMTSRNVDQNSSVLINHNNGLSPAMKGDFGGKSGRVASGANVVTGSNDPL